MSHYPGVAVWSAFLLFNVFVCLFVGICLVCLCVLLFVCLICLCVCIILFCICGLYIGLWPKDIVVYWVLLEDQYGHFYSGMTKLIPWEKTGTF